MKVYVSYTTNKNPPREADWPWIEPPQLGDRFALWFVPKGWPGKVYGELVAIDRYEGSPHYTIAPNGDGEGDTVRYQSWLADQQLTGSPA